MRIDHIGVSVAELEKALAVFVDSLGFELVEREVIDEVRIAFVRLGSVELELVEDPGSTPGLTHLGLAVDDLRSAELGTVALSGTQIHGTRSSTVQRLDASTTAGIPMHLCERVVR